MVLRSLSLLNYRNLEPGKLELSGGLTAVVGGNGHGKTNLLEAAYLVLTGVLDTSRVETAIRVGEREAHVGAVLEREDGVVRLEVGLAPGRRVARVDGNRVRAGEIARHASAVLVRPEDSELALGSPSVRRAFLDGLLSRLSARYAHTLALYERTLAQRNAALRHAAAAGSEPAELDVWTSRLAELGVELLRVRRRAAGRLAPLAASAYASLAGPERALGLSLFETASPDGLADGLRERRREELARGTTVVGPHRDDLRIELGGLVAIDFASRGEARTIALALRKAELDLLAERFGESPVLLLDDFTAELDASRRGFLLDLAARSPQALVTGTESPPGVARQLRVEAGKFREECQHEDGRG